MKSILLSIVAVALFTACSGKKYYEPEETSSNIELNKKSMSSSIKSMNRVGATLEDNEVITKQGISSFKLPVGFEFLNFTDDGKVIATNYVDKILIGERERTVKDVVVAAARKDEKLALIYSNNSMELIDVDESCLKMIKTETYFFRGAKNMTIDAEKAIELTDDVTERFSKSLDRLTATHQKFSDKSKKASGDVRDAANKLAEGLIKIEKVANFERLERYVELLERAAQAMSVLAELEKNGKLEKIANAIK